MPTWKGESVVDRLRRGRYDRGRLDEIGTAVMRVIESISGRRFGSGRVRDPWGGADRPRWIVDVRDALLAEVNRIRGLERLPAVGEYEIECCMDWWRKDMRRSRCFADSEGAPVETTVWGYKTASMCALLALDCWNGADDGPHPR